MQESNNSIPEPNVASELVRERGVRVSACSECGACTEVCPVAFAMDVSPADLMTQAKKGAGEALLTHTAPWVCTDCRRCSEVCPVRIDVARAMEGLRLLAYRTGCAPAGEPLVRLHQLFWDEVSRRGRVHELSLLWRLRHAVPGWRKKLALVAALLGRRKLSFRAAGVREWPGLEASTEAVGSSVSQGERG